MRQLFLIVMMGLPVGCASLTYEHKDYGRVEYYRFGGQEMSDVTIKINGQDIQLGLGRQAASGDEVGEVAGAIASGVVRGVVP